MKKSLFLSTLIATAALALPAWAYTVDTDSKTITFTSEDTDTIATIWGDAYSGYTVIFNGVTTSGLGGGNNAYTCYADIVINAGTYGGGLTITNGWSGASYTFTGNISGAGDWTMSNSGVAEHYIFTGSMSGYSGTIDFSVGSSSATFNFGNGMELTGDLTNVSGTGAIIINGTLEYNYTASGSTPVVTIGNSSSSDDYAYGIKVTTLTFAGSVDYVVNVAYIEGFGGTSGSPVGSTSGNNVKISTTGSVTFAGVDGSMSLDYLGTLTVDEGSTLIIDSDCTMGFHYGQSGYGLFVNGALEINEGKSLTINKHSNGGGATVLVADLKLDNGSAFIIRDGSADTITLTSVTVANNGSAKIASGINAGNDSQDKIVISSLTGTNATLTLDSAAQSTVASIFELGGKNTSTTFTGRIILTDDATGDNRGMSLVISDAYVAAGAVIEMGAETNASDTLALGVNALTVEIAGLVSAENHTGADIVYSGTVSLGSALGSAGENLINGTLSTMNTSRNTLAINTATGQSYEFNGTVLKMLNLEKSGAGKQTINFASGSSFDGSINVKAGELALGGEAISSTGLTVAADATLTIANSVSLVATSDVTSVSSTISGTLSIESGGSLGLAGTVTINNAITNAGTITIDSNTTSFVLDSLTKGTSGSNDYYVLITGGEGATVSADGITISNFTGGDVDSDTWSVWAVGLESGYLVIYGEAQTTAGQQGENLTWAGTDVAFTWNTNSENAIWNDTDTGTSGYYFTDGNNVTFGADGAYTTVAVEGEVTAGSTTIKSAYTFNIDSGATLTTGTLTYDGGSLALTGSGKIVTGGAENTTMLAFDASNFTGEMDFTQGHLDIANSTFNGDATVVVTANTITSDDTTGVLTTTDVSLSLAGAEENSNSEFAASLVLAGDGGVIIRSNAASKTVTFSGSVTGESATLQLNGGGNAVFTNTVNVGKYTNYQGTTTFSGATTLGELQIYKTDGNAGDVTFTGSNAQAAVTNLTIHSTAGSDAANLTVSNGASLTVTNLVVNHDVAIAIDKAALSITTSVTQTEGTSTSVTISNGGTLALGDSVSLNVAAMEIVLGTDTYTNGTYAITGGTDSLIVSEAAIRITVDEALAELLGTDGTYTFDIYSGLSLDEGIFDIDDILSYSENVSWNNGVLTVVVGSGAIPEPSMFGVIFGLGALGLVATRRRRRKAA